MALRIIAVVLRALAAGWFIAGTGGYAMKNAAFATERPAIDRAAPARMETATFALG